MQSFKTSILVKALASAIVAVSGVAAPALSHASPDDGMICRTGYSAQFAGGNLKCTKHVTKHVSLECTNPTFPIKRIRIAGIPNDKTGGRDVCLRNNGVALNSNDPLTGFTAGQDFVFVAVNQTKAVAVREATERAEEAALGLGLDGVDSSSVSTLAINGGVGAEDNVTVDITLFTFPVPAPAITLSPILIDRPVIDLPLAGRLLP